MKSREKLAVAAIVLLVGIGLWGAFSMLPQSAESADMLFSEWVQTATLKAITTRAFLVVFGAALLANLFTK